MENSKSKSRKLKKIHMKYPAPYSYSWSSTEKPKDASKMNKSPSFQGNKQRQCCWSRPKPLGHGCDPYAPHLKYGVFPRRATRESNSNIDMVNKQAMDNVHVNKKLLVNDTKKTVKKGQPSHMLVVHASEKLSRRLSSSGVTHVDIQPRGAGYENYRYTRNKAY